MCETAIPVKVPFYEELVRAIREELDGPPQIATDVRIINRIWPMIFDWAGSHVREAGGDILTARAALEQVERIARLTSNWDAARPRVHAEVTRALDSTLWPVDQ